MVRHPAATLWARGAAPRVAQPVPGRPARLEQVPRALEQAALPQAGARLAARPGPRARQVRQPRVADLPAALRVVAQGLALRALVLPVRVLPVPVVQAARRARAAPRERVRPAT